MTVTCAPAPGSPFNNGTTSVTCEAVDSRQRKASCSFSVVVTPVPQLLKTTFLAFGDSLTEGKTTLRAPSIVRVPTGTFNTSVSYVEQLDRKLTDRYQDQPVTVIAYGFGRETAAGEGEDRLRQHWAEFNPDALLLFEGINDLTQPAAATTAGMDLAVRNAASALTRDVQFAKSRGARVFLATLPPVAAPQRANIITGVPALNDRIRSLAAQEGVTMVDLNGAVPKEMLGADGLHPTVAAYELIADEWLKAIIATMEITPSALQ